METIRVLLAGASIERWRPYRQRQWIGVVRRNPAAALWGRLHFDIDEESYRVCLLDWPSIGLPRRSRRSFHRRWSDGHREARIVRPNKYFIDEVSLDFPVNRRSRSASSRFRQARSRTRAAPRGSVRRKESATRFRTRLSHLAAARRRRARKRARSPRLPTTS